MYNFNKLLTNSTALV